MDELVQFLSNNWKVLFGGIGAVLLAWALNRWFPGRGKEPVKEVADALVDKYQELLREKAEEIQALTKAVEALEEQRQKPEAPPGIKAALKQLAQGETGAAEAIFEQVLERKKGEAAPKEAAAAARHIGALAYLHDTQKALSAYAQAVDLDPEDPDGWNRLGLLQRRLGDMEAAIQAFERVLALGNKVNDKVVVAAAYGNLGLVYFTRRKLEKAEEYHLKALAIEEELGRKEGMASSYGNLGLVYRTRGDLAKAEEFHLKALALNEELGRKKGMASDYGNLGNIHATRGDLMKAEEYYRKSLALKEELGHKEGMATDHMNLGIVYEARGDVGAACPAWVKSRQLFLDLGAEDRAEKVQKLMDEAGCGREEDGEG